MEGVITDQQQKQNPNIFLVKTPAKPPRIIPNFPRPFQPFRPVKTSTPRPQSISFRPSVPVRPPSLPPPRSPPPPPSPSPPNTFLSGLAPVKTFQPTATFRQPTKAPPVFFQSEHSNVATRVPVVGPPRPTVMPQPQPLPPTKPPVRPIPNVQVSSLPNSILPKAKRPISSLRENPITTTLSPASQFFSVNPEPSRFKPSPKIPINSLIPVGGNIRGRREEGGPRS